MPSQPCAREKAQHVLYRAGSIAQRRVAAAIGGDAGQDVVRLKLGWGKAGGGKLARIDGLLVVLFSWVLVLVVVSPD